MNLVGMLPHFDASWHTEVANDEDSKDDGPYWTYPVIVLCSIHLNSP